MNENPVAGKKPDENQDPIELLNQFRKIDPAILQVLFNVGGEVEETCASDKKSLFEGFYENPWGEDFERVFFSKIPKSLIPKIRLSKIIFRQNTVFIGSGNCDYFIPQDFFDNFTRSNPEFTFNRYRGLAIANTAKKSPNPIKTPILIFAPEKDKDFSSMEYLDGVEESEKEKIYFLGNIFHEIGHHISYHLFSDEEKKQFEALLSGNYVTDYAAGYAEKSTHLEEEIAEIFRLFFTVPEYLKLKFPEIFNLISKLYGEKSLD